jgi:hypothetical protein
MSQDRKHDSKGTPSKGKEPPPSDGKEGKGRRRSSASLAAAAPKSVEKIATEPPKSLRNPPKSAEKIATEAPKSLRTPARGIEKIATEPPKSLRNPPKSVEKVVTEPPKSLRNPPKSSQKIATEPPKSLRNPPKSSQKIATEPPKSLRNPAKGLEAIATEPPKSIRGGKRTTVSESPKSVRNPSRKPSGSHVAPSLRPPPAAPRLLPPPLPALLPPRNARRRMTPAVDAFVAEVDRFSVEAGAIAGEQGLPLAWEEVLAFRSFLLGEVEKFLDLFGPDTSVHVLPPVSVRPMKPVSASTREAGDGAEFFTSVRPGSVRPVSVSLRPGRGSEYPVVDVSEIAELLESLRPPAC